MSTANRKAWERIAVMVAEAFEGKSIPYHFDGSSSFYLRGAEFDMDDLDVTVMWGKLEAAKIALAPPRCSDPVESSSQSFKTSIEGRMVHVMAYPSESGIGLASDREPIMVRNRRVWAKTAGFYLRHIGPSHPLYLTAKRLVDRVSHGSTEPGSTG